MDAEPLTISSTQIQSHLDYWCIIEEQRISLTGVPIEFTSDREFMDYMGVSKYYLWNLLNKTRDIYNGTRSE